MRGITRMFLATCLASGGSLHAQSAAACAPARDIAALSSAQVALLKRASLDPVVGCAALDAVHRTGDVTIASGDTLRGNIVVLDGTLRIAGTLTGSAIALNGAVVIDSSGRVLGDVIAAERGAAIAPAGRVDGELRTLDAIQPITTGTSDATRSGTLASLKRTAALFGVLILLGIGVLTNAGDALQRISTALSSGVASNMRVGIIAQLALLPVLLIICLMLTLTLLAILLVPFAIVAYVIAVLGLVVLGGLGAAQMVGAATARSQRTASERGARLQALLTGMLLLSLPWLAAAALSAWPFAAVAVRTLAVGLTWVAATAGLGAALRTRGGTRSHAEPWGIRRPAPSGVPLPAVTPASDWLTPTPITGVVAVKRPTATTGSRR
jgi:hypothetical protein